MHNTIKGSNFVGNPIKEFFCTKFNICLEETDTIKVKK